MKRLFILLLFTAFVNIASAQIPFTPAPLGKGTNLVYFEFDFRPGVNDQSVYTYWQHGVTNWLDLGFDFEAGTDYNSTALTIKPGYTFSQWFSLGAMIQPWFSSSNNFKYEGTCATLLMQGSITKNERLYWLTNTEIGFDNEYADTYTQQWKLGYTFTLKNDDEIIPMIGISHSLKFDEDATPNIGICYYHKRLGVYLWGNDLTLKKPAFAIAIEFTF